MGKGSTPRPVPDRDAYERNWNHTFGGEVDSTRSKTPGEPERAPGFDSRRLHTDQTGT